MNQRRSALLALIVILVLACNLPGGTTPTTVPATQAIAPTAAEAVDVATDTPAPVVPTLTVVPSPSVPMASPSSQAVNCRSGPALGWGVVTLVQFGQSVEIVGKNSDATWVQVKNPGQAGGFCWMYASVVTVTGNLGGVPIAYAPVLPTGAATLVSGSSVTSVSISLSKTSISVGGCVGPIQPLTVYATVWVNGPVTLHWHFQSQQKGNLGTHALVLSKATGKDISDTFTPDLVAGKYWVKLVIDGEDLSGMDSVVTYKISC